MCTDLIHSLPWLILLSTLGLSSSPNPTQAPPTLPVEWTQVRVFQGHRDGVMQVAHSNYGTPEIGSTSVALSVSSAFYKMGVVLVASMYTRHSGAVNCISFYQKECWPALYCFDHMWRAAIGPEHSYGEDLVYEVTVMAIQEECVQYECDHPDLQVNTSHLCSSLPITPPQRWKNDQHVATPYNHRVSRVGMDLRYSGRADILEMGYRGSRCFHMASLHRAILARVLLPS
eukprot:Em0049g18a